MEVSTIWLYFWLGLTQSVRPTFIVFVAASLLLFRQDFDFKSQSVITFGVCEIRGQTL